MISDDLAHQYVKQLNIHQLAKHQCKILVLYETAETILYKVIVVQC